MQNKLNNLMIKNATPREKPYRLSDGGSLYLNVSKTGAKSFFLKYNYDGVERTLTFGQFPAISLARAREMRAEARTHLAEGRDPSAERRTAKLARQASTRTTLETVAADYHAKQRTRLGIRQHKTFIESLRKDIFPALGKLPITAISAQMLHQELERVEGRGAIETAHRIRRRLDAIFDYAIRTGRATTNPAALLDGTLEPKDHTVKHPAVLNIADARRVYASVAAQRATPETIAVSKFLALTGVRSGDVRGALWTEFEDLTGPDPSWVITSRRLKGTVAQKATATRVHIVPLSPEAVAVIEGIRPLTGHLPLVFASPHSTKKPLSDSTISAMYRRAGWEGIHVPHGWRTSFSTIMNELYPEHRAAIDRSLAHAVRGVEGRYNRSEHHPRRRQLLDEWATMLTGAQADG